MLANTQRYGRLLNILAPSVQRRKVWLTPTTRVPCSNAAKMRNPLTFAGVPQTRQRISAASGPKFTILWGHVGRHCFLWSPYVIGQTILFLPCDFFFFLLLSFFLA